MANLKVLPAFGHSRRNVVALHASNPQLHPYFTTLPLSGKVQGARTARCVMVQAWLARCGAGNAGQTTGHRAISL
jgi:hypothetical protein